MRSRSSVGSGPHLVGRGWRAEHERSHTRADLSCRARPHRRSDPIAPDIVPSRRCSFGHRLDHCSIVAVSCQHVVTGPVSHDPLGLQLLELRRRQADEVAPHLAVVRPERRGSGRERGWSSPTSLGYGACWRSGPSTGSSTATRSWRACEVRVEGDVARVVGGGHGHVVGDARALDLGRALRSRSTAATIVVDGVAVAGPVGQGGEAGVLEQVEAAHGARTGGEVGVDRRPRRTRSCRPRSGSCRAGRSSTAGCPPGSGPSRGGRRPGSSIPGCAAPTRRARRRRPHPGPCLPRRGAAGADRVTPVQRGERGLGREHAREVVGDGHPGSHRGSVGLAGQVEQPPVGHTQPVEPGALRRRGRPGRRR